MDCFALSNSWKLRRDWSGEEEKKLFEKARAHARAMYKTKGNLIFVSGRVPASAAEFVSRLCFTSSSNFAALWVCDMDIVAGWDRAKHLHGIALDIHGRPVEVWDVYREGQEIGTLYRAPMEYGCAWLFR